MKQQFQKIFGISLPFPKNIFPNPAKMTCVYGNPIPVEKNLQPSEEFVARYQAKYINAVEQLYAQYGPLYNSKKTKTLSIR